MTMTPRKHPPTHRDGPAAAGTPCDLVIGLGKTGYACARYLHALGRRVIVNDSRAVPPLARRLRRDAPALAVHAGAFDPALLAEADRVIVSPGVPMHEPIIAAALAQGLPVLSDIDLFFERRGAPVAGITGSNGKSTVTSWLQQVLVGAGKGCLAGGNLGTPALELLDAPVPDVYALELSSFQLERSGPLELAAAALLNVSPDHLDHHRDMPSYLAAKLRIFERSAVAVVHRDLREALPAAATRVVTFGPDPARGRHYGLRERDGETWLARGDALLLPVRELALNAAHDQVNALAVLALAEAVGVSWPAARAGLVAFAGLPHRMRHVALRNGVTWIDDSKGTNVGATVAAVRSAGAPLVLIAGGDAKGADLSPLAQVLSGRARAAVLLGRDADALSAVLAPVCAVHRVDGIEAAVATAAALARPGDTVLLSPACSSLDMFDSYVERGERFAAAVEALS